MQAKLIFNGAALLLAAGCSERSQVVDITPEIMVWEATVAERVSSTAIRPRDGTCLDMARVPHPWTLVAADQSRSFTIAAPGDAVGIRPFERQGWDVSFDGVPHDGRVRVGVTGWRRKEFRRLYKHSNLPEPERIQELVGQGLWRPIDPWPETIWTAYDAGPSTGGSSADRSLRATDGVDGTGCDYRLSAGALSCFVLAEDEQYASAVKLDRSEWDQLPTTLNELQQTIETFRGDCPQPRSPEEDAA